MQTVETHQSGSAHDNAKCEQCGSAFRRYRAWQRFCSATCKREFHASRRQDGAPAGMRGIVSSVRLLRRGGVSVTIRFTPIEKARAVELEIGKEVGVVAT